MSEDEKIWLRAEDGRKFLIYKTEKCDMQKELTETITKLLQENQELKEQVQDLKADYGTIAQIERDLYKEVIEEVKQCIKKHIRPEYRNGRDNEFYLELNQKELKELLQILDKVKENK